MRQEAPMLEGKPLGWWAARLAYYLPTGPVLISEAEVAAGGEDSVSISSIPAYYRHLMVIGQWRTEVAAEDDNIGMRCNADTGSNYAWAAVYQNVDSGTVDSENRADSEILIAKAEGNTSAASTFAPMTMWIYDYAETDRHKNIVAQGFKYGDLSADTDMVIALNFSGRWKSTSAITSLSFRKYGAGTQLAQYSKVQVYGIR